MSLAMSRGLLLALPLLAACSSQSSVTITPPVTNPPVPGQVRAAKTEWGQSVLSSNLRLVAGKPALLRVYAVGTQAGLSAALGADVYAGAQFKGSLSFKGPATLPTAQAGAGDLSGTYTATLPADWVAGGLEVRLYSDAGKSDQIADLKPAVGTGSVLYLTLVPVIQPDQRTPAIPSADLMKDMFPVKDVQVMTRAPFIYGSTVTNNGNDWGRLLSAIDTLRTSDGSQRYYVGVVKAGYSSGVAGIGYVGYGAAVTWDAAGSAPGVMAHEVGHNLSMYHAPCGTTDGLEKNWPSAYANAMIGTWGYNLAGTLYDPNKYKDVMSYCRPSWISDYTYGKLQSFLEANPPKAQSLSQPQDVLLVSGRIKNGVLELNPLQRVRAVPSLPQPGAYTLRLEGASGSQEISYASAKVEAPHGPGTDPNAAWDEEQFSFSIPDPGNIAGLEVRGAGRSLLQRSAGIQSQSVPSASLSEGNGFVSLRWDASAYPFASVAHLGAERTTLGLWLRGGQARLSSAGLPAGGKLEVSLSDGINSSRLEFAR